MYKYSEIISRLSAEQKLKLLTDIGCLGETEFKILGIPEIKIEYFEELLSDDIPSPSELAHSFEPELALELSKEVLRKSTPEKASFIITPSAKPRISPYREAISEEPMLCAAFAESYIKAVNGAGMSACLDSFALHSDELDFLDEAPNKRTLNEFVARPLLDAMSGGKRISFIAGSSTDREKYSGVVSELANGIKAQTGAPMLRKKLSAEETVSGIANGIICFEGSEISLAAACNRYSQLKKSVAVGKITASELEAEVASGTAMSPEALDLAVDRLLDFAFENARKVALSSSVSPDRERLFASAAVKSTVLLKNTDRKLPLKLGSSVCAIGDIAVGESGKYFAETCLERLESYGYASFGTARGYDMHKSQSPKLFDDALILAKKSDTVLLFLGFDAEQKKNIKKTGKLSIPANQQALLSQLAMYKAKIVAILPSDIPADIERAENCSALLLLPMSSKYAPQALADILAGRENPSGRLASTLYLDSDAVFARQKAFRKKNGSKVGPFVGARYFDSSNVNPGFPFGFGLGYSEFEYSKFSLEGNEATVTVKNNGKMTGIETVQLYIGCESSNILRAKKELCGFVRVELAPKQTMTVKIPYKLPEYYDEKTKSMRVQGGEYVFFVGASSTDIHQAKKISINGERTEPDGEALYRYLENESNIIQEKYILEADHAVMKKSVINITAGAIALALAVSLGVFMAVSNINVPFLAALTVILAAAGAAFFVIEATDRRKAREAELVAVEKENKELFKDAEELSVLSVDTIFADEFDNAELDYAEFKIHTVEDDGADAAEIDRKFTFAKAAADLERFALEKGIKLDHTVIATVFSSMAASRLVVLRGMKEGTFISLLLLLGEYFGSRVFLDTVDDSYRSESRVMFYQDTTGVHQKTNVLLATEAAKNDKKTVYFAALDKVRAKALAQYITPFVNFAKSPLGNSVISLQSEGNSPSSYYIPQNIWFFLNLAEDENICDLPPHLAEIASVCNVEFSECAASGEHTFFTKPSYHQFDFICEKITENYPVSEEIWKKTDRIEEYAARRSEFKIGNKLWLCLEKYASVMLACECDPAESIDRALAAKLVPSLILSLDGKIENGDRGLAETLEVVFGDGNTDICKALIENSGANLS